MPVLREDLVIQEGDWESLGVAASELRRRVFIEEQQVPKDEEWDGRDADCRHFLALHQGVPVGTARLLPDAHIGRVAVLGSVRGLGIGAQLMQAAIAAARRDGHPAVELAAQTHALSFYRRLGFEAFGDEFMEAGIAHRNMRLTFTD